MKNHLLLAASAVAVLTAASVAAETRVEKKDGMTCTITESGNEKKVICTSEDGPTGQNGKPHVVVVPEGQGENADVDVTVTTDGKTEKRVVVVRRGLDGADENKDGKVSRKEFLARAEKHFAELDKNNNGTLEGDELHPPMPPMPPLPPGVPMLPEPPVPPAPPAPPHH